MSSKFLRIATRVAYESDIDNLLSLNRYFRKTCGEDIPGIDLSSVSSPESLRRSLMKVRSRLSQYPAYPCVFSVLNYLEAHGY